MAEVADPSSITRLVDEASGARYVAKASNMLGSTDHGFRVELTDGRCVWLADVTSPPPNAIVKDWMCKARHALAPQLDDHHGSDKAEQFSYRTEVLDDGSLKVQWSWGASRVKANITATAQPAGVAAEVVSDLLHELLDNCNALMDANTELTTASCKLERMLAEAVKNIETAALQNQQLEEDLFTKFAAVLNQKKQKCRELQSQVDELQQQLAGAAGDGTVSESTEHDGRHEEEASVLSAGPAGSLSRSLLDSRGVTSVGQQTGTQSRNTTPVSKARRPAFREDRSGAEPRPPVADETAAAEARRHTGELQHDHPSKLVGASEHSDLQQSWAKSRELLEAPTQPLDQTAGNPEAQWPLAAAGAASNAAGTSQGAEGSRPAVTQAGQVTSLRLGTVIQEDEEAEPARPIKVRKKAKPKSKLPGPGSRPFMDMA